LVGIIPKKYFWNLIGNYYFPIGHKMNDKTLSEQKLEINLDPFISRGNSILEAIKNPFGQFCKYIKVGHPIEGIVPIDVSLPYKKRMAEAYENHHFNVICKFRQGGFTTFHVVWSLWKASTTPNTNIGLFFQSEAMCRHAFGIADFSITQLPALESKTSVSHATIEFKNGSKVVFRTPKPTCGHTFNYIFVDEAAFIHNMLDLWCAVYPTLCPNRHITICSSLPCKKQKDTNWFYKLYKEAKCGKAWHAWNVIPVHFEESPMYTREKIAFLRERLGSESFAQEILCLYEE
jgi:hypothetical protein